MQDEFDLSGNPDAYRFINSKLNKTWREYYEKLLKKHAVNEELSDSEILESLPDTVSTDQFKKRMRYSRSEKGKVSIINFHIQETDD